MADRSGPQEGEYGKDPAMQVGRLMQAELVEDAGHGVREGIVHILEDGGFEVAGTAVDAHDLVRITGVHRPGRLCH